METVNSRKIEKLCEGKWVPVDSMLSLNVGDTFRMFEHDGAEVVDSEGGTSWIVSSQPFSDNGIHGVQVAR